jgi:hypothetical protein
VSITSGQDDEPEGEDSEASGYLVYELNEWSRESRSMVQQLLEGDEVPFVWEGTNLVVPAPFEARADEAIEQVEATALPPLDPEADKLLYELGEWSDDEVSQLVEVLAAGDVPYDFDVDGNLVVLADDEQQVEQLLDAVEFPDALAADDGDDEDEGGDAGPAAHDVMSDLFVAADRLRHNAHDHEGVLGLVDAATAIETVRLPYGFEPTVWKRVVEGAASLRMALEADDTDDDAIEAEADEYRTLLREFV